MSAAACRPCWPIILHLAHHVEPQADPEHQATDGLIHIT